MKSLAFSSILLLAITTVLRAEPISEDTVVSPKKSFTITQTREEDGVTSRLTFQVSQKRFVLQPSPISWRGFYTISPDESWILRIQKTGSGDNNAWLYEVKNGKILPEQELGECAWQFYAQVSRFKDIPLYHTGFDFVKWDSHGSVILTMHGTSDDMIESHHVRDFVVRHNLSSKTFTKGPLLAPANRSPAVGSR